MNNQVYLDNAATTKVLPEVVEEMMTAINEQYANAHALHSLAAEPKSAIRRAEGQLRKLLGADKGRIIFTSGGTESNNLAILGAINPKRAVNVVTTEVEHSSVLMPFSELERRGVECRYVKPCGGKVEVSDILEVCDENTALVSVGHVNSELGCTSDIAALGEELKRLHPKALLHTDAVQSVGKLPFTVRRKHIHMLSVSGHKFHAPKGIGALYIAENVRLSPILFGGGDDIRPGTPATELIVALGKAAEIAAEGLSERYDQISGLRDMLLKLCEPLDFIEVLSPPDASPYITMLSAVGYKGQVVLNALAEKGVYLSTGSACNRGSRSHVLDSAGFAERQSSGALRVSLSRHTTEQDIHTLVAALREVSGTLFKR